MKPPAKIKPWLSVQKMYNWLENAPDEDSYKRRHAVWLTHTDKLHARKVADILDVSVQAVWLWIAQYNKLGPEGLERKGRGGRRWSYLTRKEETRFLKPFIKKAKSKKSPETAEIKHQLEKLLGKKISRAYVYKLLQRHGWSNIIAQSKTPETEESGYNSFKLLSQPWYNNLD